MLPRKDYIDGKTRLDQTHHPNQNIYVQRLQNIATRLEREKPDELIATIDLFDTYDDSQIYERVKLFNKIMFLSKDKFSLVSFAHSIMMGIVKNLNFSDDIKSVLKSLPDRIRYFATYTKIDAKNRSFYDMFASLLDYRVKYPNLSNIKRTPYKPNEKSSPDLIHMEEIDELFSLFDKQGFNMLLFYQLIQIIAAYKRYTVLMVKQLRAVIEQALVWEVPQDENGVKDSGLQPTELDLKTNIPYIYRTVSRELITHNCFEEALLWEIFALTDKDDLNERSKTTILVLAYCIITQGRSNELAISDEQNLKMWENHYCYQEIYLYLKYRKNTADQHDALVGLATNLGFVIDENIMKALTALQREPFLFDYSCAGDQSQRRVTEWSDLINSLSTALV